MSEQTINLALPYILPSQAQKHVTHNEALQRLDAAVQLVVLDTLSSPPSGADDGECYAVGPDADDAWSGKTGWLAFRQDGAWIFIQPREGWRAWFAATDELRIHRGGNWTEFPLPSSGSMAMLGLNATADSGNRLAVASAATMLSHAGAGHQLKVNKAVASDTGSLLFQTGWSGRAEMGLAGNDAFSIKVSADGSAWVSALEISAHGRVHLPQRPTVCAAMNSATVSQTDGSRTGFQSLHVDLGGFALGAAVPGGSGNRLIVPESGLYLINLSLLAASAGSHGIALVVNGATQLASLQNPGNGGVAASGSISTIIALATGDWLSMTHAGTADVEFGPGSTCISATML